MFVKDAIKTEKMDTVKAELKKTYKHDVNENTVTPVIGKRACSKCSVDLYSCVDRGS